MHKFSNTKGFTLIETILAMMVVAIGIFGTMHLFYNTVDRAFETDAYIQATALARERLEEITFDKKMNGYAFIVSANYPTTENLTGIYSAYTRTVTILEVNPADLKSSQSNSGYKKITVKVSWNGGSVTLDTLLTFWGEV